MHYSSSEAKYLYSVDEYKHAHLIEKQDGVLINLETCKQPASVN